MLLITTVAVVNALQVGSVAAQNIDVEQKIQEIKTAFPLLSQNNTVEDVIHKVQGLDKNEALKTLAAYHILRNYQEFQALDSGTGATNSTS